MPVYEVRLEVTIFFLYELIDQEVQGSNDATANESQEKTTRVDVASEQKEKDINDSPFDLTPANPKNEDSAPTEGPPISDQVVETTSRRSHTGKFTMPQQKKEDGAVVQSTFTETSKIPLKTAMCVSTLSPVECRLTQELQENKQDVTGIQHARSNQKYQPGKLKEMRDIGPIDKLATTKQLTSLKITLRV